MLKLISFRNTINHPRMDKTARIRCPNCAQAIDVSEVLYQQLQTEVRTTFEQKYSHQRKQLEDTRMQLEEQKSNLQELVHNKVTAQLKQQTEALEFELRTKVQNENKLMIKSLQKELEDKSSKVRQFLKMQAEFERQKRSFEEQRLKIEAESEQKLNALLIAERERLQQIESEKSRLKIAEKDQIIEQLRKQALLAQRKAEQGSMQTQGEVQELAIESWLRDHFPLDTIEEIKKGVRGADCIQIINTRNRRDVGRIYYESKCTKTFQPSWIEKLKLDMQNRQVNVGVLISESMPKGIDRVGQKEGIWICRFEDLNSLVVVLRESLIQISRALLVNQNKGDKMTLLYDYLTGPDFRIQIEAMVEGFVQMQTDLERERRAMEGLWKKREKQIEKVLFNANQFYSSIRGIAGNAVPEVRHFELPEEDAK